MTKQDYCKRVNSLISETMMECAGIQLTGANMWINQRIPTPFHYGAISEHCMEKQLQKIRVRILMDGGVKLKSNFKYYDEYENKDKPYS